MSLNQLKDALQSDSSECLFYGSFGKLNALDDRSKSSTAVMPVTPVADSSYLYYAAIVRASTVVGARVFEEAERMLIFRNQV